MFWTVVLIIAEVLLTLFVILSVIGLALLPGTVYKSVPSQQNPMEGKTVRFVKDESDSENAEGIKGHLEEVDKSQGNKYSYRFLKRLLDIIFSFFGMVILSPVFIAITLAIIIDDPGPAIFTQKRVGRNKQYFKLHKFRSMSMSAPHDVPTHMLTDPDRYITRVGKFIRSHSLDELPQLWDIFVGNMSVIGPRPALWNQDYLIAERDKYHANDVKPGLSGWAQINGRDELSIEDKASLDGEYIKHFGFTFDCKCFFRTVSMVAKINLRLNGKK